MMKMMMMMKGSWGVMLGVGTDRMWFVSIARDSGASCRTFCKYISGLIGIQWDCWQTYFQLMESLADVTLFSSFLLASSDPQGVANQTNNNKFSPSPIRSSKILHNCSNQVDGIDNISSIHLTRILQDFQTTTWNSSWHQLIATKPFLLLAVSLLVADLISKDVRKPTRFETEEEEAVDLRKRLEEAFRDKLSISAIILSTKAAAPTSTRNKSNDV